MRVLILNFNKALHLAGPFVAMLPCYQRAQAVRGERTGFPIAHMM